MTRGAVLVLQGVLLVIGLVAYVMREQLGGATWVMALAVLAGIRFCLCGEARTGAGEEA